MAFIMGDNWGDLEAQSKIEANSKESMVLEKMCLHSEPPEIDVNLNLRTIICTLHR